MEPVTMAEVARRAQTSPSAVSRALNGRPGVRPEIRARVLAAAADLGYSANHAARSLAMGRSGMVALIIPDRDAIVGTTFFSELVGSVTSRLDDADLQTVLLLPNTSHRKRPEQWLRLERFDGAVVIGHRKDDPILRHALKRGVPTVTLGRPAGDLVVTYVDIDNVSASRDAARHLIDQGARRLVCLAGPADTTWGKDRVQGFREAADSPGVRGIIEDCDFSARGGRAGIESALKRMPDADGVLVSSEALMAGVIAGLHEAGRSFPDDLLLVTFDDNPSFEVSSPSISAVRQPLVDIGNELSRVLIDMLEHGGRSSVSSVTLAGTLQVRKSSQPHNHARASLDHT